MHVQLADDLLSLYVPYPDLIIDSSCYQVLIFNELQLIDNSEFVDKDLLNDIVNCVVN